MDMYKFGNYICRLREQNGMTQAELSFQLDVSDKTVSKWENGQAFPRIETFERLAQVLGTTMQDILSASRDGVRRVCFYNDMCPVLQIEVNGTLALLRYGEARWIEVGSEELVLRVRGDGSAEPIANAPEDATRAEKFWNRTQKFLEKVGSKMCLHTECTYRLSNVREDSIITIVGDTIETDDPLWFFPTFCTDYPRIQCEGIGIEILEAQGLNKRDAVSAYRKMGIIWWIDECFVMLLLLPFLGLVGRWHCRNKVVTQKIRNIDVVREQEEQKQKKYGGKRGCLMSIGGCLLVLVLMIVLGQVMLPDGVPVGRTYEVASDYSRITCENETYLPISALPSDAEPVMILDATVWDDAVLESDGFWDFLDQDHKVQLFVDAQGRLYLWLVEDYAETMLPADGSEREFDDFSEHLLFAQQ